MTNQWIKCSEKLPDVTSNIYRAILVYDTDDEISMVWATSIKDLIKHGGVTH